MPSKFGNIRTKSIDGRWHPSAKQARRWNDLLMLQRAGQISNLKLEVPIPLLGKDGPLRSDKGRHLIYRADFTYRENGEEIIEDAKGEETAVFKLKRSILSAQGITLRIT